MTVATPRRHATPAHGRGGGIVVGEAAQALIGTGALAIGAAVLVGMRLALLLSEGFVGEGMMFVNQTAASAILVIALHRSGTARSDSWTR